MSSESQSFICEHCNNEFISKTTLIYHQKNALFCLKIQNEDNNNLHGFKCEYCETLISSKKNLLRHINICKKRQQQIKTNEIDTIISDFNSKIKEMGNKYDELQNKFEKLTKQNDEYKSKIDKLKNELKYVKKNCNQKDNEIKSLVKKLAEKPTTINNNSNTTTNNTIINSIDLSQERFNQIVQDKYDYDMYTLGSEGGKQLLYEFLSAQDGSVKVELADFARNKIRLFNLEDGSEMVVDDNSLFIMCKTSKTLSQKLKIHSEELCKKPNTDIYYSNIERSTDIALLFKKKTKFNTCIFEPIKAKIVTKNAAILNEYIIGPPSQPLPQLNNEFEEKE